MCEIKFYILVTHSITCKSGKFYNIRYRIDSAASIHGNLSFGVIKIVSHYNSVQDLRKYHTCEHLF